MNNKLWENLKKMGNPNYRTGATQPIDIYREKGTLIPWALCEISQHAIRNMGQTTDKFIDDMDKIIIYAQMLRIMKGE
jgi:hypothetical protein